MRGRTVEVVLEEGDHQVGPIMVAGHEVIIGPEPLTVVMANSDQGED